MILNSLDTQFKLLDNGQITWQRDLTNPMAGDVVAEIVKGKDVLNPDCSIVAADCIKDEDQEAVKTFVQNWLATYIKTSLESLFNLQLEDIPQGAPREVCDVIFAGFGVIKRADIQTQIAAMDEEQRGTLRTKKIRFGPLLVYLPELNKPAAVKLRALLISLWEEKELPATVPADGIVSFSVEGQELDKAYYQSIGYPIYGPRSIRVDMLDRVICAVYDVAQNGKFMAQHKMAEWLGSNIPDLYAILEAMGHKKIHEPAPVEEKEVGKVEVAEAVVVEEASKPEGEKIEANAEATPEKSTEATPEEKQIEVKPELATFALKKGKAIDAPLKKTAHNKSDNKKPFKKNKKPQRKAPQDHSQRVYTAEAETKPEDNPFAILQQLKTKE